VKYSDFDKDIVNLGYYTKGIFEVYYF